MIAMCSPSRWKQYTKYCKDDYEVIKHIDRENKVIVLHTSDIDLLCWLTEFGELRHWQGYILLDCYPHIFLQNIVSYLQNSYEPPANDEVWKEAILVALDR